MRPSVVIGIGVWLAAAGAAGAGAWLREDGSAMLAFAHERIAADGSDAGYTSLYGEYGLSDRLTIGIDAGIGEASDDWKAVLFARMGREFGWLPGRVAAELGLGAAGSSEADIAAVVQPGLSWGHSFETDWGWAWVNLDAKGLLHLTPASETAPPAFAGLPMALDEGYKVDLTVGLNLTERSQLSLEVRFEDPVEGVDTLRLVPGYARRIGARAWVTVGGIVGLMDGDGIGIAVGSRIDF